MWKTACRKVIGEYMKFCPKCGSILNDKNMCTNFNSCNYVGSSSFDMYSLQDSVTSELRNNLVIVNAIIEKMNIRYKPEFFVLGGAALAFYGLIDRPTLDIDTANSIDDNIRACVEEFISDQASNVTELGDGYKDRAVEYMPELAAIKIYLLSQEDLIITKMRSGRHKDINDLLKSEILTQHNVQKAISVLETEYPEEIAKRYIAYVRRLKARKESFDFDEE